MHFTHFKKLTILAFSFGLPHVQAATSLTVGDISILGYSSDGVDEFSFVTWVDLDASTQINFTDRGWRSGLGEFTKNPSENPATPGLVPSDGTLNWTSGSFISAGSVITATLQNNNPDTAIWSIGSSSGDFGHSGLSSGGESIFAYQGAATSPNFIFGLYYDDTTWGTVDPGEYSTGSSQLPSELNTAIGNIVVPTSTTNDNGYYSGTMTGESDLLNYRTLVLNNNNWTVSNTEDGGDNLAGQLAATSFDVVPEPSSSTFTLLALSCALTIRHRRS